MAITEDAKCYRVACWLDSLLACAHRLADVRAALSRIGSDDDGVGAVRYDRTKVRKSLEHDAVVIRITRREDVTGRLEDEERLLEQAVWNAERIIRAAWKANEGEHDKHFNYVIEHYAHGVARDEAARSSGLGGYESMLSSRKVAALIYDSSPESFSKPIGEWSLYGYWYFVDDANR